MLDIHQTIDSRWAARDVADLAFAAGYNHAMSQNAHALAEERSDDSQKRVVGGSE
jgi:hypothetical protein